MRGSLIKSCQVLAKIEAREKCDLRNRLVNIVDRLAVAERQPPWRQEAAFEHTHVGFLAHIH